MISRAVLILVATTYMAVGKPTSEYATPAETYDTPMADKSPEYTVEKIVDYDYAVNDYYGNEQSKREHIEAGKQTGEYRTRLANGDLQIVNYDSGDEYGHRATVENIPKDHPAPEYMGYKAPVAATATSAMTDAYTAPAMTDTYAAPAMTSYSSAPSYTTPAPYSHASSTVRYMIRKKLYVQPAPQTYTAPAVVVSPMVPEVPKMHYNYEEKNTYMASPTYMTKAYWLICSLTMRRFLNSVIDYVLLVCD